MAQNLRLYEDNKTQLTYLTDFFLTSLLEALLFPVGKHGALLSS